MPSERVQFQLRWKEECVGTIDGHRFVIECTMGSLHVYLPTEENWEAAAPDWATSQWRRVQDDLSAWCADQDIPLHEESDAWVDFSED